MDLNHFHIQVTDMSVARTFYETFFEFSEDLVCGEDEIFIRNRQDFVLGLERVANPESLPSWFHFGFGIQDEIPLKSLFEKMKNAGVKITRDLQDFGDSINFYCVDPDGNKIEVYYNRQRKK